MYSTRNPAMLRRSADTRAVAEISQSFKVYTASLMKDYMSSTMAGDPNVTSEEQHLESAIKTVTSNTLSGVQIVDRYHDFQTGEYFALARLDINAFKSLIEKSKELNERAKEYIKKNAESLHQELNKETLTLDK
jgi:hypothetical protein